MKMNPKAGEAAVNMMRLATTNLGTKVLVHAGPALAQVRPIRSAAVRTVENYAREMMAQARTDASRPLGVDEDRMFMGLALAKTIERVLVEQPTSEAVRRTLFQTLVRGMVFRQTGADAVARFQAEYAEDPGSFLVISPGKTCNLRCTGCYADAGPAAERLDWSTFDRIITEAKSLWDAKMFVISGGEPMAYRSDGKGVLDMAEKHRDCLFLMYTNGTLINDGVAARMAKAGNLTPALSVEGMRERTDARRGAGVFDQVLAAMARLRREGVPFGVSLTATRHNCEEILSDELVDFFFGEQGAVYGFIFHYMPIGRSITLDLMPTPQQRLWLWRRSWDLIRERRIFLADFWNHGTTVDGCVSAGRGGGYLHINWEGAVSPCVFVPYSPVNINRIYAQGKTLNDVWAEPFFANIRAWQRQYGLEQRSPEKAGNWMAPCIIRDHHAQFREILSATEPDPVDDNAKEALLDQKYSEGMAAYGQAWQELSGQVWEQHYQRRGVPGNGNIPPLPRVPVPGAAHCQIGGE